MQAFCQFLKKKKQKIKNDGKLPVKQNVDSRSGSKAALKALNS